MEWEEKECIIGKAERAGERSLRGGIWESVDTHGDLWGVGNGENREGPAV